MFVFGTGFASTGELIEHVRMPDFMHVMEESISFWVVATEIFLEFDTWGIWSNLTVAYFWKKWVGSATNSFCFFFLSVFFLWQCFFLAWLVFPYSSLIGVDLHERHSTDLRVPCRANKKSRVYWSDRFLPWRFDICLCFNIRCPNFSLEN